MNKSTKPSKPIRLPEQSQQEKEMQVARFLANKKETFFQLILANLIQAGTHPKQAVDLAIEGADYAIVKLYPIEKKEDK